MLTICSFLQSFCRLVHVLTSRKFRVTRKMYRTTAILMSGTAVVAVMAFSSTGFSGGGRNALTAFAGTSSLQDDGGDETAREEETEETVLPVYGMQEKLPVAGSAVTEAKIQFHLTDPENRERGRRLVGNTLAKSVEKEKEIQQARRIAIKKNEAEIRRITQEREREEQLRQEEESRRAEAVVCYSDQDYEVLTRIVQSEAGVCSMKGKILVANVVINRVRDEEFPDDITEVVYQRNQFSPVGNGAINRCSVSEETKEAVDRALSGEDYSDGALYFMNRRASQSGNVRWFDGSLTYLFQYEGHEFFK